MVEAALVEFKSRMGVFEYSFYQDAIGEQNSIYVGFFYKFSFTTLFLFFLLKDLTETPSKMSSYNDIQTSVGLATGTAIPLMYFLNELVRTAIVWYNMANKAKASAQKIADSAQSTVAQAQAYSKIDPAQAFAKEAQSYETIGDVESDIELAKKSTTKASTQNIADSVQSATTQAQAYSKIDPMQAFGKEAQSYAKKVGVDVESGIELAKKSTETKTNH